MVIFLPKGEFSGCLPVKHWKGKRKRNWASSADPLCLSFTEKRPTIIFYYGFLPACLQKWMMDRNNETICGCRITWFFFDNTKWANQHYLYNIYREINPGFKPKTCITVWIFAWFRSGFNMADSTIFNFVSNFLSHLCESESSGGFSFRKSYLFYLTWNYQIPSINKNCTRRSFQLQYFSIPFFNTNFSILNSDRRSLIKTRELAFFT